MLIDWGDRVGQTLFMWRNRLRLLIPKGEMKATSLRAGLGETAVRDILTGRVNDPSVETLRKIALALGKPLGEILGEKTEGGRDVRYVTVVGTVSAGYWRDVTHNYFASYEISIPVDPKWPADAVFALEVSGNSINRKAADGDWVLCLKADVAPRPFQSGDWVIVEQWDGDKVETTVKRVKWNNGWELWPDSSDKEFQEPTRFRDKGDGAQVRVTAFVLDFVSSATRF